MKKFRFYVHFKGGDKATDWIYCDSEQDTTSNFLGCMTCSDYIIDDKGNTHFIKWANVNYAKAEEVV